MHHDDHYHYHGGNYRSFLCQDQDEIHIKKGFRLSLFHPFPNPVNLMNKKDASLRYVSNDFMTNTSLRERFSIAGKNYSMASRIIADAMDKKMVKRHDPENLSKKHAMGIRGM